MASKLNLDDDQMFKLMKFKRSVTDILQPKHDEKFLLRWLRARSWDVSAAEKMLRKSMDYREQWEIDGALRAWIPPEPLASHFPSGLCGYDKEGHPIYVVPMENVDIVGFIHTTSKQDLVRLTIKILEETLEKAEKNGKNQLVAIFDLDNFNLRQFAWKPAVELVITLLQMYEANYPEILRVCYIINAPKLFSLAYSVIKKFINEYTQSKIKIYKQESMKWRTALLEHVDPDNIPKHYGGSMVDPDGNPRCPSKIRPGKIIPKHLYRRKLTSESIVNREYVTTTIKKGKQLVLDFYISDDGCLLHDACTWPSLMTCVFDSFVLPKNFCVIHKDRLVRELNLLKLSVGLTPTLCDRRGHLLLIHRVNDGGVGLERASPQDPSAVTWDFHTENHDIRFGITYTDENGNIHTVIQLGRTSANVIDVTGTIQCKAPASYTVTFDNSYSVFRNKVLHYYVGVTESLNQLDIDTTPKEEEDDVSSPAEINESSSS